MDTAARLHVIDMLILAGYLAALTGIGVYHAWRPMDLRQYFLAGKSIRWLPVGLSLMAALNSGTDYIMQPAGMIKFGAVLLVVNLSWLFLYPYVFWVILPLYRRLDCYTAYEYLERRFGVAVRLLTALVFLLWRLGWMATALYVPCLTIAVVTGWQEHLVLIIVALGAVVTFYTMAGGIRAVVWTDVMQFGVMFGGLAATVAVVVWKTPGGLGAILAQTAAVGAESREAVAAMPPGGAWGYFLIPVPVIGYLLATLVSRVTTYTSDQVMVQRFQTSRSIRDARQGFVITALGDVVWMTALCFVGVALFAYYQSVGGVPEAVRDNPDHIFPYFLSTVFPAGLTGLVVAAILAASLSSIDSALSAITTVLTVDFYQRFAGVPAGSAEGEDKRLVRVSRGICLAAGAAGIVLAANVSRMGTVLEISSKIINGFTGPILGIFLLGMFMRRATTSGVFVGGLAGTLASIYAILWSSPDLLRTSLPFLLGLFPDTVASGGPVLSFIWPSSFGLVTTLVLGAALSLVRPAGDHGSSWTWRAVTRRNLVE